MNETELIRGELARSAIWADCITAPLRLWGAKYSMALAHGGRPLVFIFLPVIPAILLFGASGLIGETPNWLFNTLAIAAAFGTILLLVHAIRSSRTQGRDDV